MFGRARPNLIREIAGDLILILAGIAAACMLAEVVVRLSGLGKPQFYTYSSDRGWQMRAGASGWQSDEGRAYVRINRWGYRGPDWSRTKRAYTLRIAVVGDSFVEAQQVPENQTFCAVMERELMSECEVHPHNCPPRVGNVRVMNFGVDGYGTAQELMTLDDDVWQFAPDIVVLAFFAGNDVRNDSVVLEGDKCRPFYIYRHDMLILGGPFIDSDLFRFRCFMRFESRHSQLLNVAGSGLSVLRSLMRGKTVPGRVRRTRPPLAAGTPSSNPDAVPEHEPGINDLIYRPPVNQVWTDAWKVTEEEIEMMHRAVERHGAIFLVAMLGTGVQVFPNPAVRRAYLQSIGGTDIFYPEARIRAFGERNGFAVLNLAPTMQAYADAHQVFFHGFTNTRLGSGHWNAAGHDYAGKLMAVEIQTLLRRSGRGH